MGHPHRPLNERFWDKVVFEPMSGCWLWTGSTTRKYGQIKADGKVVQAHRISYMLHKGPIPEGMVLDHMCRNEACVNPDHLRVCTQRENLIAALPYRKGAKHAH